MSGTNHICIDSKTLPFRLVYISLHSRWHLTAISHFLSRPVAWSRDLESSSRGLTTKPWFVVPWLDHGIQYFHILDSCLRRNDGRLVPYTFPSSRGLITRPWVVVPWLDHGIQFHNLNSHENLESLSITPYLRRNNRILFKARRKHWFDLLHLLKLKI